MMNVDVLLPIRRPHTLWLSQTINSLAAQEGIQPRIISVLHPDDAHVEEIFAKTTIPVKVVAAPSDGNLSAALNAGLAHCSAKYTARIDQDDVAEPGRLMIQESAIEGDAKCLVLGSSASLIDANGRFIGRRLAPSSSDQILRIMRWKNALMHSTVLFRTEAIQALGGYSVSAQNVEDYDLWLRVLVHGKIQALPEALTRYRIHSRQMTKTHAISQSAALSIRTSRISLASASGTSQTAALARHYVWNSKQTVRRYWRMSDFQLSRHGHT